MQLDKFVQNRPIDVLLKPMSKIKMDQRDK